MAEPFPDGLFDGVIPLSVRARDLMLTGLGHERLRTLAEAELGVRKFGHQLDRSGVPVYDRAIAVLMAGPLCPAILRYLGQSPLGEMPYPLPRDLAATVVQELRHIVAEIDGGA